MNGKKTNRKSIRFPRLWTLAWNVKARIVWFLVNAGLIDEPDVMPAVNVKIV